MAITAGKILNGTFGHVWVDDEKVAELKGLSAKIELETEEVKFCGSLASDRKVTGYKCTGSLKLHKVSSKFQKAMTETLKTGKENRFTIIFKIADPQSDGEERVALKNVAFDDLTIADFEVGALMSVERPFTFTDVEYLDTIE